MRKIIKAVGVILLAFMLEFETVSASTQLWDGFEADNEESQQNAVCLVNMNLLSSIMATSGSPSSKVRRSANYSCRWNKHDATGQINFAVPGDWSELGKIFVPIYSANATGAKITMVVECQYVPSASASSSYFYYQFNIDWTGWKVMELSLSDDLSKYNNASWAQVLRLKFSADGWGGIPDPRSDLYFDSITGVPVEKSEENSTALLKGYSAASINQFKKALGDGAAVWLFSQNVYSDGKSREINPKADSANKKDGETVVPVEFWKTAFGAEISGDGNERTVTLGNKTVRLVSNELSEGITVAPYIKEECFYVPLEDTARLFGLKTAELGLLSLVGSDEQLSAVNALQEAENIGGYIVCAAEAETSAATEQDFAAVKANWRHYLVGDENNDLSNEYTKKMIDKIDSEAESMYRVMNFNADAAILFGTKPVETTNEMGTQYNFLWKLARAYGTYGSKYYKSAQMKSAVLYGLEWLYNNLYGQDEAENNGWRDIYEYNWWDWYINVPNHMMNTLFVMEPEMLQSEIEKYMSPFDFFRTVWCADDSLTSAQSRIKPVTAFAVLSEDAELMNKCMHDFDILLQTADNSTGFSAGVFEDGSYITHSVYPMEAAYGTAILLDRFVVVSSILSGTKFELRSPQKYNQMKWMKDTFRPVTFNGTMLSRTVGREPGDGKSGAMFVVKGATDLLGCFSESDDEILKEIIKENVNVDSMNELIHTLDNINYAKKISDVLDEQVEAKPYERAMMRYKTDLAVKQTKDYTASVAMSSSRIATYESINDRNKNGWHQGDGALFVYNDQTSPTNDQFGNKYFTNANMYRLPGTTEDTQTRDEVSINTAYLPPRDFVGGVEMDSKYIAAAFDFEAYHSEEVSTKVDEGYGGGLPQHFSDLTAKKSYFMFDDEIVALGSAITSSNDASVNTYVENRELKEKTIPDNIQSNKAEPYKAVSVSAAGHDGNVPENVLDDNMDTRWSYQAQDNGWLMIELAETVPIGYVGISFYGANGNYALFDIELSEDGENWVKAFSGQSSGNTLDYEGFNCGGKNAKYVKFVGAGRKNSQWNSITEMKAFPPRTDATMLLPTSGGAGETIKGTEDIVVDGQMLEKASVINREYTNPSWIHLENFGGYFFPSGGDVVLNKTDLGDGYFELWLKHGIKPQNESYSYIMLPGKNSEQCAAYTRNPDVTIDKINEEIHVVKENALGITAIVFWKAGTYGDITVTEPMIVMLKDKDNRYEICAADPTGKLSRAQIIINRNLENVSHDEQITLGVGTDSVKLESCKCNKHIMVDEMPDATTLTLDLAKSNGKTIRAAFRY